MSVALRAMSKNVAKLAKHNGLDRFHEKFGALGSIRRQLATATSTKNGTSMRLAGRVQATHRMSATRTLVWSRSF